MHYHGMVSRRINIMKNATVQILLLLSVCHCIGQGPLAADDTIEEPPITAADRGHWSFLPVRQPTVPEVKSGWPRNAIDQFVLARLHEAKLQPSRPATKQVLIRRVTFDLTGLPPTAREIEAFVSDQAPDAYNKLVDRLLASKAYGERWAQHWLDLARFAETDGYEHDKTRSDAWHYRDWLIDTLNADLPYDQFIAAQLAGDEIDRSKLGVATGFLLSGPDMPDMNDQDERRHVRLNEMASTVGSVFMGLTFGCAQCHDHKYDPISQADFYRLRAFFDPTVPTMKRDRPLGMSLKKPNGKVPASRLMLRGRFDQPGPQLEAGFLRVVNSAKLVRGFKATKDKAKQGRTELAQWLTQPDHPLTGRVIVNRLWTHHFGQGLVGTPSDFGFMGDSSTHPKLLDWLASELPARKWSLKAMHKLMVTSATYRQASSRMPTQNERPVVSPTKIDPKNRLLWRMNRQRLEGEAIRDAMLFAAGRLRDRRGGPGIMAPLPKAVQTTLLRNQWKVDADTENHRRRSVYLFVRRNLRYPLFDTFDRPDGNQSCARRGRTTTAPQSLYLLNSEFSLQAARDLAGHVLGHAPNDTRERITVAYQRTLGRKPTSKEMQHAMDFLVDQTTRLSQSGRKASQLAMPSDLPRGADVYPSAAFTDFCLVLFNLNEFIYID